MDEEEKRQAELDPPICKGRFFDYATTFAAGMLLALAFCHLLPEMQEEYAGYLTSLKPKVSATTKGHHGNGHRRLQDTHAHEEHTDGNVFPLV